ncbi:MAG: insulinase family protein [Bacteroidales bacterium]|nr:insulinase family protein [Bacteroidales bacterium]HOY40107.1 pitrilysin family protein [Bacteroidales bacterium]HQP03241.1 pitrilysin family protein [Bacteroidales bacterium]
MINFEKYSLSNGLKVILHQDLTTPMVVVNVMYDVGARDENPERTGFAHLFEHLMFGGSVNVPEYDRIVQKAGGENNAFTNNDITNYYVSLPSVNLEAGLWIESDRMLELAFSEKSLEVQRNVVVEEFNQRYLNQPYGDVMLHLRPLAYCVHPYRWNTIGEKPEHIRNAVLEDVKEFFFAHYAPNNAILVVAGNFEPKGTRKLIEKWFGTLPARPTAARKLPIEPLQTEPRIINLERDVPQNALYRAYHMVKRLHRDYYATDLISDILSNGRSSWFFERLIKDYKLFSEIDAYIMGSIDPGLFLISGKPLPGKTYNECEAAIDEQLQMIISGSFTDRELEKVKNRCIAARKLEWAGVLNKAIDLAYFELLGNAAMINAEEENYRSVTRKQVMEVAAALFSKQNCSTLYYNKTH